MDSFGRTTGVNSEEVKQNKPEKKLLRRRSLHRLESDYDSYSEERDKLRSRSPPRNRNTQRHEWEVPPNPLARSTEGGSESPHRKHRHHRHHHHRGRHHHDHHHHDSRRSRSRSSRHSRSPPRARYYSPPRRLTEADTRERWGHELYIEKVIMNPEPEPPRIYTEIEAPEEKWISKAGGVAIFTNRPTSASAYQGKRDDYN